MRCECPKLRRCCLCLPLRFGLIGTAWIKLVLDALCLMFITFAIHWSPDGRQVPVFPIIFLSVTTLVVVVDVGFNCVLLRGCHRKDPVLLRLFYRYSLFLLGLNTLFIIGIIILDIVLSIKAPFVWILTLYSFFTFLMFCVLSIILHLYFSILVRSEVQKLEGTTQFQFTNTTAEGACTMAVPSTDGPDNVLDALCLMYIAFAIHWSPDGRRIPVFSIIFLSVATVVVIVDVGFNCVLLRGCHRKDTVLLRLFYRYSLFLLGLNKLFVIGIIILDIVLRISAPLAWILTLYRFFAFLMFCVLSIILHIYFSILVRSEVQKLEGTTQFQFTNTTAEGACTMAVPSTDGPDNV